MDDLQAQFRQQVDEYLLQIQNRIKELFKEAIQTEIYDYYEPTVYHRNQTFIDNVRVYLDADDVMHVYSDLNEGSNYYSAVDGSPQFQNIAHWLESGHSDGIGEAKKGYNQYHQFEGRRYLERAKELISAEFPGLEIEVIDNE